MTGVAATAATTNQQNVMAVSDEKKLHLLRVAMEKQFRVTRRAISGFGVDNHLLGLKTLAEEEKCDEIFTVRKTENLCVLLVYYYVYLCL